MACWFFIKGIKILQRKIWKHHASFSYGFTWCLIILWTFPNTLWCLIFEESLFSSKSKVLMDQSCLTLCDPLDYSPRGSSIHGLLQARILEWVAISSSRGSSWPCPPLFCIFQAVSLTFKIKNPFGNLRKSIDPFLTVCTWSSALELKLVGSQVLTKQREENKSKTRKPFWL